MLTIVPDIGITQPPRQLSDVVENDMGPSVLLGVVLALGQPAQDAPLAPAGAPPPRPGVRLVEALGGPSTSPTTAHLPLPSLLHGDDDAAAPAPFGAPRASAVGSDAGQGRKEEGLPDALITPVAGYGEGPLGTTAGTGTQRGEGATTTEPLKPVEEKRRAMPSPFDSPPFPGSEYQGYPLIGVPPDNSRWPLMKALQGTPFMDLLDSAKIRVLGWVTVEGNWSNAKNSNTPDSYWIRPNTMDMDQAVLRFDRNLDSVQTDHIDWGFRLTQDYGIDYRYFTAGGWFSDQLLKHNFLYGYDPTEVYADLYVPWVAQGMIIRVGRWIACPDIETQFSVDNYMGSHSLLFTFDTYTQTGIMGTWMLNKQWTVQAAIHSGTDMAPWYKGAIPTGAFGVRWVSQSNNDAMYTWLNAINNARFRRFDEDGQPAGHDNFNYLVSTWEHRFSREVITKTEGYFMWQRDAVQGGTPSIGPVEPFGGGGGIGPDIPGTTLTYGLVNFTIFQLNHRDFITVRNEWWKDNDGERSGFPGTYSSHAIGYSHFVTPEILFRPEIGFYRNWHEPAFDNGTRKNLLMAGFDLTFRF
jgi:hypothetical protein